MDLYSVLCLLEGIVTVQLIFGPLYDIIHKLSSGKCPALDITHKSYAEDEVGVVTWLMGYPRACLSLHLPLTERVTLPTLSASHPDLSSPVPILPLGRW